MSSLAKKNYIVKGIVLHRRNFFETDRILTVFTRERGIISCIVKGARKSTSKLAGSSELFTYGNFYFTKGKNIDILTGCKAQIFFQKKPEDLKKISEFFLLSEMIQKMMPHEVPNPELFDEMINTFKILEKKRVQGFADEFIYKALTILGYGLAFERCAKCSKIITQQGRIFLNFEVGGALCNKCFTDRDRPVTENCYKLLKYISAHDVKKYSLIRVDGKFSRELSKTIQDYLNFTYQKEMNSAAFIRHVRELQKHSGSSKI